ncbi:hypothetical protein M422DRAFT_70825 [Sphaerobolus stellatus SS14]|uniref:BTB domain-containing protein n=1 Tax=Sphaerobolus stellatus (strain SS14) TaxID=990650 RepID=A0A0C9UR93_SPHS4|nr:hypothetical protein M422DRAFT_70825 [Sphaerobolus stellatus SS14]
MPVATSNSKLYHRDGSIVLVAEEIAFKVHQSVLANHSEPFNDIFAAASPIQGSETFKGVPVVRILDKAGDLEEFLSVIYSYKPLDILCYGSFESVLRIADRYMANELREKCLKQLERLLPVTLEQYDTAWDRLNSVHAPGQDTPASATKLIAVAHEVNAFWLLPQALNTLLGEGEESNIKDLGLPQDLLLKLYCARGLIVLEIPQYINNLLTEGRSKPCCRGPWRRVYQNVCVVKMERGTSVRFPLDFAQHLIRSSDSIAKDYLCKACFEHFITENKRFREDLWSRLPEIFGLASSWEELEKARS